MSPAWTVEGLEVGLDHFHLGPVDLSLVPGSAVAVLGPSGAGKTTLLRSIAGFLPLRGGRVLRDGVEVSDRPPEERCLGYVPQGLGLFPHRTVEANVRYPLEVRDRPDVGSRARQLLERFHLGPLAKRFPARLSGGEQQRVAIARALAADPELLLWDEPWQGLDVLARHELGVLLQELRETEGVPMVVVTHDPGLAFSIADSFLLLGEGHVREQCDAATLLRAPGDPFAARFVGFENVFAPEGLEGGPSGSLRGWLLGKAGPQGVAFPAPRWSLEPPTARAWEARVRSVRPHPDGLVAEVVADELPLTLRLPPPVEAPLPTVGQRIWVRIDPDRLLPLGTWPPGAVPKAPSPGLADGTTVDLGTTSGRSG